MEKEQIIDFINQKLQEGKIDKNDLHAITENRDSDKNHFSNKIVNTLYIVGGIIVLVGVIVLIATHWKEIGFGGRILSTFGIALATYLSGWTLKRTNNDAISQIMFFVSVPLAIIGTFVLFKEYNIRFSLQNQLTVALGLFVVYGMSFYYLRSAILLLATVGLATWAYFSSILNLVMSDYSYHYDLVSILKISIVIAGLAYILIAYAIQNKGFHHILKNIFYGLGTIGIIMPSMASDGIWNFVTIILIFAAIYGSVFLKNKVMLFLGSVFLIMQLIRLTAENFSNSLGWPIALIFAGFVIIAVGYFTLYINRKYISN